MNPVIILLRWQPIRPLYRHMATITATPITTLMDEKVAVKLTGLHQGSKVTVRSNLSEQGQHFEAHGHYVADSDGVVALDQQQSLGGTYIGVEPMGLFWSMTQSPGQRPGLQLARRDATIPMKVTLSLHKGHHDLTSLQSDTPVTKTEIIRSYIGQDVEVLKVHTGRIRGLVFKPKGFGPFKGVIDLFGTAGGLIAYRAALLASHGFAVYALPYFRYKDLPDSQSNLDLDYFEEATDWLQSQPYVEKGGIGICAVSWGAEVGALMAATFPGKISACVSISGSCVRTFVPLPYKGNVLPFLGYDPARMKLVRDGKPPLMNTRDMLDPLEKAPAEAFIQLEKAQRLLFIVGLDDRGWKSPEYVDAAERRLRALGCDNYEIVRYPKTGHVIEPPYAPITLTCYYKMLKMSSVVEWGGSPMEHQRACEDHWPRVLTFLNTHVAH